LETRFNLQVKNRLSDNIPLYFVKLVDISFASEASSSRGLLGTHGADKNPSSHLREIVSGFWGVSWPVALDIRTEICQSDLRDGRLPAALRPPRSVRIANDAIGTGT
jgi:hypothetical protein